MNVAQRSVSSGKRSVIGRYPCVIAPGACRRKACSVSPNPPFGTESRLYDAENRYSASNGDCVRDPQPQGDTARVGVSQFSVGSVG